MGADEGRRGSCEGWNDLKGRTKTVAWACWLTPAKLERYGEGSALATLDSQYMEF